MASNREWDLPDSEVTPEQDFNDRRRLIKAMGLGLVGMAGVGAGAYHLMTSGDMAYADEEKETPKAPDKTGKYPAKLNEAYKDAGRKLTPEKIAGKYNNFYEFSLKKDGVHALANKYPWTPWKVEIAGLVKTPKTYSIDELVKAMPLEERRYRFRCVEAWSMTVPWTGFSLATLLKKHEPLAKAKYVRFVTVLDKKRMPGQRELGYPWPYYEGLSIAEAMNELTLMVTGIYGHPLPGAHGAPIRLIVPWKYGFKSIKSVVKIELVEKRPKTFWSDSSREYGFWANVNPKVAHPRWSQATERLISTGKRVDTQIYNGYGKWVADMYKEISKTEKTWF